MSANKDAKRLRNLIHAVYHAMDDAEEQQSGALLIAPEHASALGRLVPFEHPEPLPCDRCSGHGAVDTGSGRFTLPCPACSDADEVADAFEALASRLSAAPPPAVPEEVREAAEYIVHGGSLRASHPACNCKPGLGVGTWLANAILSLPAPPAARAEEDSDGE